MSILAHPVGPLQETRPAAETIIGQVLVDLATFPRNPGAHDQALAHIAEELARALEALDTAHTRLLTQERLATLGRLAAELAHELKNPLAILRGGLELLARELEQHPPDEAAWLRHHLDRLQRATAQILRLVSSLSTASKPPRAGFQPVAVADLLNDTHEPVAPRLRQVRVGVEPEPALHVAGDRSQLLEVLLNLATNAVEAMDAGGALSLRAWGEAEAVIVEVADTGPGIPPELEARVWEPFFTTKAEGTGLGLAIVRELVDAHGGSLSLASQPGAGTTVRLRLPACAPSRTCP